MRDLSSKLRAIIANTPSRELIVEPDAPEKRGVLPPPPDIMRAAEALGGRPIENRHGAVLTVERRYEADRWHGAEQIGDCEIEDFEPLRALDARFAAAWPAPDVPGVGPRTPGPLFFDLETTGLSGGAGTVAFLVGCAWFDCGALQVRQFVLTSLAAERALLEALRVQFAEAPFVASYNGRTFDAPLMDVRWAFHRLPSPFDTKPHFDMLPPARRLWKHRGEQPAGGPLARFRANDAGQRGVDGRSGCSLMAFERQLLGYRRVDDVPGFEIPSRFFHFLRTGDAAGLESVLEHNRLDLVSLAVLTARAARIVRGGPGACADARESLALGRIYEQTGRIADARACYERAAEGDRATRADALSRLAISLRKEKRYEEAAAIWRRLVGKLNPGRVKLLPLERLAMEALAVHHEHREKDLALARQFAEALNDENGDEGIRRRLDRIERKMSERQAPLLN